MKKMILRVSIVLFVFLLGSAADAKPTLAVRTFENKTGEGSLDPPSQAITDMMTTELYDAGLFRLVERESLDLVAEELRLAQSGLMDPDTAPEIGHLIGAKYQMTGSITGYYYNISGGGIVIPWIAGGIAAGKTAYAKIDLRVIDSATGETVYAASEQGTAKREASGILTKFGGFGSFSYGGILATATRDCVTKHVMRLADNDWPEL